MASAEVERRPHRRNEPFGQLARAVAAELAAAHSAVLEADGGAQGSPHGLRPSVCVGVAFSGGRDSTALLHAAVQAAFQAGMAVSDGKASTTAFRAGSATKPRAASRAIHQAPIQIIAMHVHHGLSDQADDWLAHCERLCASWSARGATLNFASTRLNGRPAAGESVEAWGRTERYRALAEMARSAGAGTVMLAQHRTDQAETFLLQALRGAGMRGLASMPAWAEREGLRWSRPWLDFSRRAIEAYVDQHGLVYVDDDSNSDVRYARNLLRLDVMPSLEKAFPRAEQALAASARWAGLADQALAELAALDLPSVTCGPVVAAGSATGAGHRSGAEAEARTDASAGSSSQTSAQTSTQTSMDTSGVWSLDIEALFRLSEARRSNVLRAWLETVMSHAPAASLVQRLLAELRGGGRSGEWQSPHGRLRRYRGRLAFFPGVSRASRETDASNRSGLARPPAETTLSIATPGIHAAPGWLGHLLVEPTFDGGVDAALLMDVSLRPRRGGERFKAADGRPARALKKQFQEAGVPAWERDGPLLYAGDRLVHVPGLGIDARVRAAAGAPQVSIRWVPCVSIDNESRTNR